MKDDSNQIFLGSEYPQTSPADAHFHIIPVPFEKSVSYGGGASGGPAAIIEASQEMEAFDGFSCPGEKGIYTCPPIIRKGAEELVDAVSGVMVPAFKNRKIPILLGGEHTVSVGAFKALKACFGTVGIIQFDAHADLRDTYQGNAYSHACVMHRALDMEIPFVQIGVRSLSYKEHLLRKEKGIRHFDAREIAANGPDSVQLPAEFPDTIYVTFDVDVMDPSIMPSTGTPEPGGLLWYDIMNILERLTASRNLIGFDIVELAPVFDIHAPDFTAARLIYNLMGLIARKQR